VANKLIDLGEHGILTSIVFPAIGRSRTGSAGLGDDCAVIELPPSGDDSVLVATADPCPRPVVFELFDADYWHYGWMTVIINLSDLAAMGARPAGILISTVMPDDMSTSDYARFWDGVVEASDVWGCRILGGNIKDGQAFSADGAALGWCSRRKLMPRVGSSVGDLVYSVGHLGIFWSAVLHRLKVPDVTLTAQEYELAERALMRPEPRIREASLLAESGLITACMDASDGVLGCLLELGRHNQLDIGLLDQSLQPISLVQKVASAAGIPPLKLMLSWGDWQLIVTIREESRQDFEMLVESLGMPTVLIGKTIRGSGRVVLNMLGRPHELANLSSERFSERSYFTHGMESYVDWFLRAPILAEVDT
jgi:thiamine-monophosphate kinase